MMTIWKYNVLLQDYFELEMPINSKVLCVQTQYGEPCIWVEVNKYEEQKQKYGFRVIGTGHPASDLELMKYIGTFQLSNGALVFHLYQV